MTQVRLEYIRKPDSSYYKSLITWPPEGITYANLDKEDFNLITSKAKFELINFAKSGARKIAKVLNIQKPNIIDEPKQNTEYMYNGRYDILHCCRCLSNGKSPWVVDIEKYWTFAAFGGSRLPRNIKIIKERLKSPSCKAIFPWSEECKAEINGVLQDEEIYDKMKVLHYSMPLMVKQKFPDSGGKVRLLFVSRYFYEKGGPDAVEAFSQLKKKYGDKIECTVVSNLPSEFAIMMHKNIKFMPLVSQDVLFKEIYPNNDIFLYPSYVDTYGFALVEAQSFGLPIISVDGFNRKELVGNAGIIIPRPKNIIMEKINHEVVKGMVEAASQLIENNWQRKEMSRAGRREVSEGKFSLSRRNAILKKTYEEALK